MIFKSKIYQHLDPKSPYVDVGELFRDIEQFLKEERLRKGMKEDDKFDRRHPLQHVLNSTSGGYVSPTAMKSFELCPAGYLCNKLVDEVVGTVTSVGRSYHTVMERFYLLDGEKRTWDALDEITETVIEEDKQFDMADDVRKYVRGYWTADDYLPGPNGQARPMEHQSLDVTTEMFIKPKINPLGVSLNVPVYLLVDRVDVRKEGVFVIDYKTGWGDPNPYLLGEHGYLPQMIFYKWGVEAEFGQPVDNVYLCLPGAQTQSCKWTEMNVNSLVEQSKVVEQVYHHIEHARKNREIKQYENTVMRYCGSCMLKSRCLAYLSYKGLDTSKAESEIEVLMEIQD